MSEPRQPEHSSAADRWWDSSDEPEYLVLPEVRRAREDPSTERREPVLQAVLLRIEILERLVDRVASQMGGGRDEIGAFASETRDGLKALMEAVDSVRTDGALLAGSVGEARAELGAALEAGRAEASAQSAALRAELDTRMSTLRAELQQLEASLTRTVGEATSNLSVALRESAQAVETTIREASRTTSEEHTSTMERYSTEFAMALRPVGEVLSRLERLGSVIEAMSKRRGFQDLVRSEQTLRQEQSALVRTLSDSSADVAGRIAGLSEQMGQLEERLGRAGEDISSLKQLPVQATERVARAVERLRSELTVVLQDRFGEQVSMSIDRLKTELEAGLPVKEALDRLRDLSGTQSELAGVQKSIDGVVASLRAEMRSLRDRIQSWGKPKAAPRLSQEVDALGNRLAALEEEVQGKLAERVAESVTDRVLDALRDDESGRGRGLFRRP